MMPRCSFPGSIPGLHDRAPLRRLTALDIDEHGDLYSRSS